jgi:uncharacterized DUF497 family protein
MLFQWDEAKRLSNIEKHGTDFLRAQRMLDGRPRIDIESPRQGEHRFLSIALLDGQLSAMAWTFREETIRIISVRRARRGEERQYRNIYG